MRPPISFAEFLKLPADLQEELSTFENAYIKEDLSGSARKKAMTDLEKKLKRKDWFYAMSSDQRVWKRGRDEDEVIRKLVQDLGDDGMELYRMYGKKAGAISEAKKDRQPSPYEKHLAKKMSEWGIKSLDGLSPEALQRFYDECDKEYEGGEKVKVNMPEQKRSMFPEMNSVSRQGTLGYGDDRRVNEKSITADTFSRGQGNLYPEHLSPKWQPPTKERMKHIK